MAQDDAKALQIANTRYKEARTLFRRGEYDDALEAVESGLAAVPNHLGLLLMKGQILLEKRDYEGALEAYEEFLAAGPRGANKRKAKKIIRNLGVVRSSFLVVTVDRGPANVYVDSASMGVICVADPTCKKGFVPGTYQVIIERAGFETIRERVTIARGTSAELTKTLVEKPSELVVRASPEGAAITVDGNPAESGAPQQVAAGKHQLEVTLAGHATHKQTVTAAEGKPIEVEVTLAEQLLIDVKPPDAEILIDGKTVPAAKGVLTLPAGTSGALQLTARKAGYRDEVIDVPADRKPGEPIKIELQQLPRIDLEPEPPPPAAHDEWTITKISLLSAGGAVTLGGLLISGLSANNASGFQSDAESLCEPDDLGLLCDTDEGFQATEDARDAANRANIFLGIAAVGAVGTLAAYTYNEPPTADGSWSLRRKIAFGATIGIAALGFTSSALFGASASDSWDEAEQFCDSDGACNRRGFIAANEAGDDATVANVGFVVGTAATASALYLWLFAPDAAKLPAENVAIGAGVVSGGGGVTVKGRF